ncbi:hypothetical protein SDC9_201926 [bioreactor metagenome]|uniref:Uncharacterized protein n=1 Tax=bioreactor metagenome TaxID=1076179 RepID=A0A645IT02_9ZZZZ
MAVIADHVAQSRPEGKCCHHNRHDPKKRLPCVCRQQRIHAPPGDERKRQVDQRHHQRAGDVQKEKPPVGLEVTDKNLQHGMPLKLLGGHALSPISLSSGPEPQNSDVEFIITWWFPSCNKESRTNAPHLFGISPFGESHTQEATSLPTA